MLYIRVCAPRVCPALCAAVLHLQHSPGKNGRLDFSHALLDRQHGSHKSWLEGQLAVTGRTYITLSFELPHIAALFGYTVILVHYYSVDRGSINLVDDNGRTLLLYAVLAYDFQVFE
jgi:hypothetical protein